MGTEILFSVIPGVLGLLIAFGSTLKTREELNPRVAAEIQSYIDTANRSSPASIRNSLVREQLDQLRTAGNLGSPGEMTLWIVEASESHEWPDWLVYSLPKLVVPGEQFGRHFQEVIVARFLLGVVRNTDTVLVKEQRWSGAMYRCAVDPAVVVRMEAAEASFFDRLEQEKGMEDRIAFYGIMEQALVDIDEVDIETSGYLHPVARTVRDEIRDLSSEGAEVLEL